MVSSATIAAAYGAIAARGPGGGGPPPVGHGILLETGESILLETGSFILLETGGPPPAYPQGVINAGLQAVWDLRTTAGVGPGVLTPVGMYALPPGLVLDASGVNSTASASVNLIDFTGDGVFATNNGNVLDITDAVFAGAIARYLMMGRNSHNTGGGTPACNVLRATFDGTLGLTANAALINGTGASPSLSLTNSRIDNAPRSGMTWGGNGPLDMTDCFLGKFGLNTTAIDHLQAIHLLSGTCVWTHCLFDPVGSVYTGGKTAIIYPEATDGPIDLTLDGCIVPDTDHQFLYPIHLSGHSFNAVMTIKNSVLQRGTHGQYMTATGSHVHTIIDGGNNWDIDGAPITF